MSPLNAAAKAIGRSSRRAANSNPAPRIMRRFRIESHQRYRTMAGMDEPLADRAERARKNAAMTPTLATKTW